MKNKVGWFGFIFTVILAIVSVGIAWGNLNARVSAAETEVLEYKLELKAIHQQLSDIKDQLTRIDTTLKIHTGDEK